MSLWKKDASKHCDNYIGPHFVVKRNVIEPFCSSKHYAGILNPRFVVSLKIKRLHRLYAHTTHTQGVTNFGPLSVQTH